MIDFDHKFKTSIRVVEAGWQTLGSFPIQKMDNHKKERRRSSIIISLKTEAIYSTSYKHAKWYDSENTDTNNNHNKTGLRDDSIYSTRI